ncbi:helix-turn-helix domain-containing protein [Aneurinibacillus thermoaerophilus]|uniref:helix-turn-helix domain-containing protein n=1 Tax=Aneurinibacillus thermoaerophilus TaxID=143495 RepID=UPI000B1B5FD5
MIQVIQSNLPVLMAKHGVRTLAEVVRQTGLSRTMLTAVCYSRGKGIPFDTMDALCEMFGVGIGELPVIRFHDLRHTHATILLQLSENPKIVSERLGHVNITITLDTYSHILPDMQKNLAQNFDVAMKNPVKRNTKSALVD